MSVPTLERFRARRLLSVALLTLLLAATPGSAAGQSVLDFLRGVQQGGGWVAIPVKGGRGSLTTLAVPTGGLLLNGCVQVYAGMSGRWDLVARDELGEGRLEASVRGGESVPFSYQTGPRGQLRVDARWSEPRDTTLLLWVGLGSKNDGGRDPCRPTYGGGRDHSRPDGAAPSGR